VSVKRPACGRTENECALVAGGQQPERRQLTLAFPRRSYGSIAVWVERLPDLGPARAAYSDLAAQRMVSAGEFYVSLAKIMKIFQRLLKQRARARIFEFESRMPSQTVGCLNAGGTTTSPFDCDETC
jgi:hypothetical protein